MRNDDKPIAEAGLWDILDLETTHELAARNTGDPRDAKGDNVLPFMADELLRAMTGEDEGRRVFLKIATYWIGKGTPAKRRRHAGRLACEFGASTDRLIGYLEKFGLW